MLGVDVVWIMPILVAWGHEWNVAHRTNGAEIDYILHCCPELNYILIQESVET